MPSKCIPKVMVPIVGAELKDHLAFCSCKSARREWQSQMTHSRLVMQYSKSFRRLVLVRVAGPLISVKQSQTFPLCCDRSQSAPAHNRFSFRPSWCCGIVRNFSAVGQQPHTVNEISHRPLLTKHRCSVKHRCV